jgi:hypothetical protein
MIEYGGTLDLNNMRDVKLTENNDGIEVFNAGTFQELNEKNISELYPNICKQYDCSQTQNNDILTRIKSAAIHILKLHSKKQNP